MFFAQSQSKKKKKLKFLVLGSVSSPDVAKRQVVLSSEYVDGKGEAGWGLEGGR